MLKQTPSTEVGKPETKPVAVQPKTKVGDSPKTKVGDSPKTKVSDSPKVGDSPKSDSPKSDSPKVGDSPKTKVVDLLEDDSDSSTPTEEKEALNTTVTSVSKQATVIGTVTDSEH